jgi:hydroxyacylglutathione hydrolase
MRVADGVVKVEGTRVGNVYLLDVADGVVVVDTGMLRGAGPILRALMASGHGPRDVRAIVLTHWHPDHIGGAAALRRATRAPVAIGAMDAPVLRGEGLPARGRRAMALILRVLRIRPLDPDVLLRGGDTIGGCEVIDVPGHTAGSIALRRPDGVVFSGDALLGDRHGGLLPPDPRLSLEPALARASAQAILELAPSLLLPGHGRAVRRPSERALRQREGPAPTG